MSNFFKIIKNFLFSKFAIAIICLALGIGLNKFINFLNNQNSATESTFKNFSIWFKSRKNQVENSKIFSFDGEKFVLNIKKSFTNSLNKSVDKIDKNENVADKYAYKNDEKINKADQSNQTKTQELKASRVNKYQDHQSYTYELVLTGYAYEDVIIAISDNKLSFTNSLSKRSTMSINGKKYFEKSLTDQSNQGFNYVFELEDYDHKIDPEITYKDNIIFVKFYLKK